ncbi:hypothetical protein QTP86_027474 [Hemibagrus guttatus]|nr:hypothetical protein QTP86_027474 [Hemibagrus guttatus]
MHNSPPLVLPESYADLSARSVWRPASSIALSVGQTRTEIGVKISQIGNHSRASTSEDTEIKVAGRLFENFGVPIQPECVPSEHAASSIPGTSNYEEAFNCSCGQPPDIVGSASSDEGDAFTPWTEPDEEVMHQEEGDVNHEPEADKLGKYAAAFVFTSREKHCLSQQAVNDIISGVQQYQASLLDCLRNQITDAIQIQSGSTDE